MRLSIEETVKKMLDAPELYVLYSAVPVRDGDGVKMAYKNVMLMETPIVHGVQAWIYDSMEACMQAVKDLAAKKQYGACITYRKENVRVLLMEITEIGAQTILYHTGSDVGEIPMTNQAIVDVVNWKQSDEAQRELTRDIQLLWQCQNRIRNTEQEKRTGLDHEEEVIRRICMSGSLMRGSLFIPVILNEKEPGKFRVPIVQEKDANGKAASKQLLGFTNRMELLRNFGQKIPNCTLCKIEDIKNILDQNADVLIVNKASTGLAFSKPMVDTIVQDAKLVADGKELTEAAALTRLSTDRAYFTVYGATMASQPGSEKPDLTIRGPYIVEEEETLDDQFYIFTELEDAQEFRKQIMNEKKLITCVREWKTRDFTSLHETLASMAVNTIIFKTKDKEIKVELEKIYRLPDYSAVESARRPIINQSLALSMQYYWQELTRMIKIEDRTGEEKQELIERNSEFLGNLVKSTFYTRVMEQEVDGEKKVVFPMVIKKDAEGKVISMELQLFTDIYELRHYFGTNIPRVTRIPFKKLEEILATDCTGVVFNPASTGLHYTAEVLEKILEAAE